MRLALTPLTLLAVCGGLALSRPARGAEPSEAAKKAARELGLQGAKLYDQGKYEAALDKLERAYAVVPAPTLGLWSAQTLVKLGRLVEASERYMEVRRMELGPDASDAFKRAQATATAEYEALQPRIPRVTIAVDGADPAEVSIFVDDLPVPASLLGTPHPVDPGTRTVRAERGDETVEETLEIAEGGEKRVVLEFSAVKASPVIAPRAGAEPEADRGTGSGQRTLGWIGVGVGGAGLAFGTVTRVLAVAKRDDLEPDCVGSTCAPERGDDVDTFNRLRVMSDVGLIAGGALLVGGAVLVLTAPSGEEQARHIHPYVGLGSAGVKGAF